MLLAARCKCGTQKSRQKSPSGHHRTTLSGYIFATTACIDNRKKNLLSSNISSMCAHNMANFGPLGAEIVSLVWGTRANFNGFRVLAALLHGTLVVGVSQTAAFNRGRHLYSAGRPSRWALAHILVCFNVFLDVQHFNVNFSIKSVCTLLQLQCYIYLSFTSNKTKENIVIYDSKIDGSKAYIRRC